MFGDQKKSIKVKDHFDIYKNLRDDIETYGDLLDIGCGKMTNLFDFEDSLFGKLIGLDKEYYCNLPVRSMK